MSNCSFPADWKTLPLKATSCSEHHSFIDGDWIEAHNLTNKGIRLIQTGNIGIGKYLDKPNNAKFISISTFEELGCKKVKGGDILICRLAEPVGRACIVPEQFSEAITSVDCTIFRPNPDILDKCFISHWLSYEQHLKVCEDLAGGSTRQRISRSSLGKIVIPIPHIEEQKTIAAILDTLDEAIAAAEDPLAKQEKMKQGLLHDLLTRGIDENGQLRSHWDEQPDLYRRTELGWIPKAWEDKTINDLAVHVGSGVTPRGGSNVYKSSGILFIRSQNVTFQGLKLNDVAFIDLVTHQNMESSEIVPHDVLLNITGASIGRCCPVPASFGVANVNQHVCAIRLPEANKTDAYFLSLVLSSYIGQNQIARFNAGGNREGLNYQQIRSFLIPWPDYPEREKITEDLVVQEDENIVVFQELGKLKKIKTGLMQDLLTGRRRVTPVLIQQVETLTRSAD